MTGLGRAKGGAARLMAGASAAIATLVFLVILALAWGVWTYEGAGPKTPNGQPTVVLLRQGAGVREIAASLTRAGVVRSSAVFSAAAQLTGQARHLKAGEYEYPSRMSMAGVMRKIRKGEVVRHFVTIPEGLTSEMAVDILMAQPLLTGAAPVPPEGALLPETYEFQRGEDRSVVLGRMMAARDTLLKQLWAQRTPNLPLATPDEAVTLASIVEKETRLPAERPHVAQVFINRLQMGMKLQSDPTIIYDVSHGRALGRGIRESELTAATPHNTYVIAGLPPTPICNPGKAALAAVMAPTPGKDIFFVADGAGGHVFAETETEQARNVAKWRVIEKNQTAAEKGR